MLNAKSIDSQIISYIEQLSEKKKKVILTIAKTFAQEKTTLWDIMPEEVRRGLERGIAQSKRGIGRSNEVVMKEYNKWLKK